MQQADRGNHAGVVGSDEAAKRQGQHGGIEVVAIDPQTGLRGSGCPGAYELPFVAGSAPEGRAPCADGKTVEKVKGWLERIFGR